MLRAARSAPTQFIAELKRSAKNMKTVLLVFNIFAILVVLASTHISNAVLSANIYNNVGTLFRAELLDDAKITGKLPFPELGAQAQLARFILPDSQRGSGSLIGITAVFFLTLNVVFLSYLIIKDNRSARRGV